MRGYKKRFPDQNTGKNGAFQNNVTAKCSQRIDVLNVMFQTPMGRFQLKSKLKLSLFSGLTFVPFSWLCWFLKSFHYHFVRRSCWLSKCLFCCRAWAVDHCEDLSLSVGDLNSTGQLPRPADRRDISTAKKTC